jgi:hypothetical protein
LMNDELNDDELYEPEDLEIAKALDEIDIDADEDDVICLQCGEVIDDGIQCSFCGWVRELTKIVEDIE